jgi:O-antigen/teichoic acid export membrane protein
VTTGAAEVLEPTAARRSLLLRSVWLLAAKGFQMGAGFLFWVVAARTASVVDVGVAAAAVSAILLCTQLGLLGTGSAVVVALGRGQPRKPTLDTAFTVVVTASLAMGVGYLAVTSLLGGEAAGALTAGFVALFLTAAVVGTVMICLDQVSIAVHHTEGAVTRYGVGGVTALAAVATLAVATRPTATGLVAAWSLASLAAVAVGAFQLRRWVGYSFRPSVRPALVRRIVRVGFANHLLTLTERLPPMLVPLILAHAVSPEMTAYWYPAWMMVWVAFTAPISVGLVQFSDIVRQPHRARQLVSRGMLWSILLGGVLCLGLGVAADLLLSLLGPEYADASVTALRLLTLGLLPFIVIQAYNAHCRATGATGEATVLGTLTLAGVCAGTALWGQHGTWAVAVVWVVVTSVSAVGAGTRLYLRLRRPVSSASSAEWGALHG